LSAIDEGGLDRSDLARGNYPPAKIEGQLVSCSRDAFKRPSWITMQACSQASLKELLSGLGAKTSQEIRSESEFAGRVNAE
jgi:hypothetical protein